jgi:hypothetical protein
MSPFEEHHLYFIDCFSRRSTRFTPVGFNSRGDAWEKEEEPNNNSLHRKLDIAVHSSERQRVSLVHWGSMMECLPSREIQIDTVRIKGKNLDSHFLHRAFLWRGIFPVESAWKFNDKTKEGKDREEDLEIPSLQRIYHSTSIGIEIHRHEKGALTHKTLRSWRFSQDCSFSPRIPKDRHDRHLLYSREFELWTEQLLSCLRSRQLQMLSLKEKPTFGGYTLFKEYIWFFLVSSHLLNPLYSCVIRDDGIHLIHLFWQKNHEHLTG